MIGRTGRGAEGRDGGLKNDELILFIQKMIQPVGKPPEVCILNHEKISTTSGF